VIHEHLDQVGPLIAGKLNDGDFGQHLRIGNHNVNMGDENGLQDLFLHLRGGVAGFLGGISQSFNDL
jgi:hypothetical protein